VDGALVSAALRLRCNARLAGYYGACASLAERIGDEKGATAYDDIAARYAGATLLGADPDTIARFYRAEYSAWRSFYPMRSG
jgi:hypothetical protein